jgi:hypothetical protein
METYAQIPLPRRSAILQQFNAHVTDRITVSAPLALIADDDRGAERPARIFTIITGDGSPVRTAALYRNLRVAADGWRSCHVGQPVAIGPKVGLRLCASMPLVSAVDQRWRTSGDLVQAMLPVVTDVDYVVSKWLAVHARG